MKSPNLIVGPPGTGKTTRLLKIVEDLLEGGISPSQVCFVAFTRKAANEARNRAQEKFKLGAESLPWFRTLHSLAFQQVGANKAEVMGIKDYLTIANLLGLSLTIRGIAEDGTVSGLSRGDRLLFMEGQARTLMMPLREYWELRPDEDIHWYELKQVADTIIKYKQVNGKRDFTDIIHAFIESGVPPSIHALVVDEAQDLSPLQWKMVEKLSDQAEQVFIAGDDDQAIFRWAGADVERFIGMEGFRIILPQSYRVPVAIQEVANRVISRCSNRIEKTWRARDEAGVVNYITGLDQIDMSKGTWLLLARNMFLLEQYNVHCIQEGFIFDSAAGSPIQAKTRDAIRLWKILLRGEEISIDQAQVVYDLMSTRERVAYGSKKKLSMASANFRVTHCDLTRDFGLLTDATWDTALDKISEEERQYFITAIARGEEMTKDSRIKVSTIHSVKGGEAENVVICPDMARRTFDEYQKNPDDEHRVFYVAVTRAKQSLHILQPTTNNYYDI